MSTTRHQGSPGRRSLRKGSLFGAWCTVRQMDVASCCVDIVDQRMDVECGSSRRRPRQRNHVIEHSADAQRASQDGIARANY